MNKIRRKKIEKIYFKLEEIKSEIEFIIEEEQECLDNIPENLQSSEKYAKSEESISDLENVTENIADCLSNLEYLINE